jgi:two-component system, OmpR family, phosphate regulon response regulator PhoB
MSTGNTILIIDDDLNLRESLSLILQRRGDRVTGAGTAQEALHFLHSGPYDLALLDIKLPDGNGMSLLPEIRKQYPNMPVLILTGHAASDTALEAVCQGARGYLLKPISPAQILHLTDEALAEQRQRQRIHEIAEQAQNLLAELSCPNGPPAFPSASPPADSTRYLRRGAILLDLYTRFASLNGQGLALSTMNFDYLVTLFRHSPNPVSYQTLVKESQGYQLSFTEAREVTRWRIHELRKTVEAAPHKPHFVQTVRGVGYRFAP